MSRDPAKLKAFVLADELVVDVYRATAPFPLAERFGLQAQIRRAAVSVVANLVEGCARHAEGEYLHHVGIAIGSASEVRYLIRLATRLGFADGGAADRVAEGYTGVIKALQSLVTSIRRR